MQSLFKLLPILVVMGLLACTPNDSAEKNYEATLGTKTYTNPDLGISFRHLDRYDVQVKSEGRSISFVDRNAEWFRSFLIDVHPATAEDFYQSLQAEAEKNPGLKVGEKQTKKVGGRDALFFSTVESSHGRNVNYINYAVKMPGGKTLSLVFGSTVMHQNQVASQKAQKDRRYEIEDIINSFQFMN